LSATLSAFEAAASIWPFSHEIRMEPAYFYSRFRNEETLARGVDVIEAALRSNLYAADLWWNLGVLHRQLGNEAMAVEAQNRARQIAPKGRFQ
jgi:hypothetical protein